MPASINTFYGYWCYTMHGSEPTCRTPWRTEQDDWSQWGRGCLQWYQVRGKARHLADKVWDRERGIRHSISRLWLCFLYRQTDGPCKLGHCWLMLVSLRSLIGTIWRHGQSTILGPSMLNMKGHVISSLRSPQLPAPLPVCLRPRSAKQSARWNAARLLALLAS